MTAVMAATGAPVGTEAVEETVAPVAQVMAATAAMAGAGVTEEMAVTVVPAEKGGKEAKEAPVDMTDATVRMAESLRGQHY
ncbi:MULTISPECIES: hypothetical protein [unclassified Enterobacter]|uniref:hypothetical protein n=1 Tax=unclassified Enterobacter TaxID=2608935 RepID=UPI0003ECDB83|nr:MULTISPECIES: hypothetical protein [unclassified Enterobacter]EWG69089.1 hypothetical protein P348_03058 [Enterobacter sp. DC3]EWG77254.1 hypothetical protein P349_00039 [Enterobacter sp. DC4]